MIEEEKTQENTIPITENSLNDQPEEKKIIEEKIEITKELPKKKEKITIKKIKEKCVKPNSFICQFRRVSFYVTKPILHLGISPTQVTWIWVLLGLLSAPFFYVGEYWFTIVGTALLCIGFLFDHIDGNVARYKQIFSDRGYYLDEIGSYVLIPAFLIALGFGGFHKTGNFIWVWLGIVCVFAYYMYQSILFLDTIKKLKGTKKAQASKQHPKVYNKYTWLTKILPAHFDEICYILIVLSILGIAEWLLVYYAIVYTGMWLGKSGYDYLFGYKK
jgi:phosphatidylglycerophosphate synthase